MSEMTPVGKLLILAGIFILAIGLLLTFWSRIPYLGKLPGDIFIQRGNFRFFFPIVTTLLISVLLTIIVNIVIRLIR